MEALRDLWAKVSWPQVVVLCVFLAAVAVSAIFAPPTLWANVGTHWETILAGVIALVTGVVGVFLPPKGPLPYVAPPTPPADYVPPGRGET